MHAGNSGIFTVDAMTKRQVAVEVELLMMCRHCERHFPIVLVAAKGWATRAWRGVARGDYDYVCHECNRRHQPRLPIPRHRFTLP